MRKFKYHFELGILANAASLTIKIIFRISIGHYFRDP
jgi:hypothetical protein